MLAHVLIPLAAVLAYSGVGAIPPPPDREGQNGILTQYLTAIPTNTMAPLAAPTETLRMIHPWGRPDVCLTVLGGELVSGAEVGISYCEQQESQARTWQMWKVNRRSEGRLETSQPGLCLAGGLNRTDATRPRLYACPQDTAQDRLTGFVFQPSQYQLRVAPKDEQSGQYCLDIRHDSPTYNGTHWKSLKDVQLWTCASDGTENNQAWMITDEGGSYSGQARPDDY